MVLPYGQREVVLRADFTQFDPGGEVLSVPLRKGPGPRPPRPGEFVYLLDGEGNGCVAFCAKVRGAVARLRPVPETWTGPRHQRGSRPARDAAVHPRRRERDHGGVHRTL